MKNFSVSRIMIALGAALLVLAGVPTSPAGAQLVPPEVVDEIHESQAEHVDQAELVALVAAGRSDEAFTEAFELGDELFEVTFNILDGVGANVGQGQRFSRVPRADLTAAGEWANHFPERATGPNGQACNQCHSVPFDDGAGHANSNVHRDPLHSADMGSFIQRNTPHLFAPGALQRLAEEMTEELHERRDRAADRACRFRSPIRTSLYAKGVSFGRITVRPFGSPCRTRIDTRELRGIDDDLVIKPFQWKGSDLTLRIFNRGASHNELGMQPVELVGEGVDGDFDGVTDELTIGDQTALAIYIAAQPRPTTKQELAALGLIPPLSAEEDAAIDRGRIRFRQIGCTSCHRSNLRLDDPIFSEPSQNPNYREETFPAGQDPVAEGVDPDFPVTFDLTLDQPDNIIELGNGSIFRLGSLRVDDAGRGVVELYGDLRRHDLGPGLAEAIDEVGTGASVFMTKELWGVGSTAPYLHDGRATTLGEAIQLHGGDAAWSRARFRRLSSAQQRDVVAFLDNLVLFKIEEEEE